MMNKSLRNIPPVHELQRDAMFIKLRQKYDVQDEVLTVHIRKALEGMRSDIKKGIVIDGEFAEIIWNDVENKLMEAHQNRLKRVINGTGTILHTNLGRARLSREAVNRVSEVAANYSNLEYDIESGSRGSRHDLVEDLIKDVTGAEAAMVVNNNAAAVYLILKAFAKGKEVIVSRGQLVEIGGSFRVSSIMEESGAKLVEVGTTNKTHAKDYYDALTGETAMLLKVHTSNFKTIGFTKTVTSEELVEIAGNREDVMVYEDLGSGVLYDFAKEGIGDEPVVQKVLETGVDLVSFSGDKLLGGPQAGIIAGKKKYINHLKQHQLARVLRVDKMSFAALEATFRAYLNQRPTDIPTVRDMLQSLKEIREKALEFITAISGMDSFQADIIKEYSMVGGGTMPDVTIPTYTVKMRHDSLAAHVLAEKLRKGTPSVIVRTSGDAILLDFRTITHGELPDLIKAMELLTYRG
ncbi:L-seryl-tRNA(Ser) seleniumtransferase [Bacillus tianshenii]|uniref:L-seryl-tRNA(Sec) selenium transferase n=1 Tax=Sutcliffiella tianshenii TaxID=1463404 RepID=A0ABS2NX71_9BACI|nr:L-seryl-tRNA(Ser) seleniumtransferase [Bacillus tianshenii]